MAATSKIEWTDASWNPIRARNRETGKPGWFCTHASEGCRNCYAEVLNHRVGTGVDYKAQNASQVELFLDERTLLAPLRWKPRKIFVGSMTDLFGEFVPDEMIDRMFAVMALCPHHIFQVLTKRAERMKAYLTRAAGNGKQDTRNHIGFVTVAEVLTSVSPGWLEEDINGRWRALGIQACTTWPLPNVWLGVSCEDQANADARIPHLLAAPAAVRFLSCEPLLGPLSIKDYLWPVHWRWAAEYRSPQAALAAGAYAEQKRQALVGAGSRFIDWVICGGESGPHARPMHPDWARSLRDQCAAAEVPFFFKQWGEWGPSGDYALQRDGGSKAGMLRLGKKEAGRFLDTRTHDEFPEAA